MKALRTILKTSNAPFHISHKDGVLLLGSCFSDNIGKKLSSLQFNTCSNPGGIIYNPLSLARIVNRALDQENYTEDELHLHNEVWHSWDFHSDVSYTNKSTVLSNINSALEQIDKFIRTGKHMFITFGTAWVYEREGSIVANCHKYPGKEFEKRLLDLNEIIETYDVLLAKIAMVNPKMNVVFTLSPVRHIKDGIEQNQISKSLLRVGIHELCKGSSHYFPSFEIVLDDLRDYRFYAKDMLHPTELAIDYIWDFFSDTYFTEETKQINQEIYQINLDLAHKPRFPESEASKLFQERLVAKVDKLRVERGIVISNSF